MKGLIKNIGSIPRPIQEPFPYCDRFGTFCVC